MELLGSDIEHAMGKRRGIKQVTLKDRLRLWAEKVRRDADHLLAGPEKDALLIRHVKPTPHVWTNG